MICMATNILKAVRKERGRECWRWTKLTREENATNENKKKCYWNKLIVYETFLFQIVLDLQKSVFH